MADVRVRFARIRNGLTPREWARAAVMAGIVIGLNAAGWAMLAAAVAGHYHISANTTLECPREKKKPTDSGRLPSLTSLRVVLSIAAMWSASKACRIPRV